jgi:sulfur-carrier protein
MLNVLVFGQLVDIIGSSRISIEHVGTVRDFKAMMHVIYPNLLNKTYAVAIENTLAGDEDVIADGSTVALMPPYSGG